MDYRSFVLLLLVALLQRLSAERLKLCVVESVHTTKRIRGLCPRLVASKGQIECAIGADRLDCLQQLAYGDADFTILEPEDLEIAAAYKEYNVLVTNELRLFRRANQRFEMVAIVRRNLRNRWEVIGSRYCHPGLENDDDWTKAFSMYFNNWLLSAVCDPRMTLLENKLFAMADNFPKTCIAGPWTPDVTLDRKLKSRYTRLCAACDDPADCSSSDKYHGREGALLCLTDNAGDIAWARLDDAIVHFANEKMNTGMEEYNFLCPDGTTRPFDPQKPCVWISKPWPVVVARSQMAETVTRIMNTGKTVDGWDRTLKELMENYHSTSVSLDTPERPKDYLRKFAGFMGASNRAYCHPLRTVHWCVVSNLEDRKCRSLREASIVYGVEPPISCIQKPNRTACLDALSDGRADIFVAKPEELLEARKKGLRPIVHAMPKKTEELHRIAAVVKQSSGFKKLEDLRGAKACFTGYRDVGWNAFVSAMRNSSVFGNECSDAEAVGNFFGDSCVLGLSDSKEDVPRNLYSLCKQADRAGDDVSTFDCLTSGLGDVAFVNLKTIEQKIGTLGQSGGKNKEYRTLCLDNENETDENSCLLTWTALSSILVRENIAEVVHQEIFMMLLEMNDLFGHSFKGQTPAFSMYGIYDSSHNVLFPEETQYLMYWDRQVLKTRSYSDIVEEMVKRPLCSQGNTSFQSDKTIILLVLVVVLGGLTNNELQ